MSNYKDRNKQIDDDPRIKELWAHHVAQISGNLRMTTVGAVAAELAVRDHEIEKRRDQLADECERAVNLYVSQIERFTQELGFFSPAKEMDPTDALVALQDMADYIRDAKKVL